MPTPSIQTLRNDAQQVLNLDSISAVRSVVAATLANANAGTPLNPNLTTQQLWNEFYQIVTQPKSDIESIIANQLMKFMYAPPAPGGVGANHEVIYNNNGVLAGDSKFLWDDALNKLDIDGSATITGDLTVDTNVLKVNTTTNRVGINTTTPTQNLQITGSGNPLTADGCSAIKLTNTVSGRAAIVGLDDSQNFVIWNVGTEVSETIKFLTGGGSGKEQYRITHGGVFNWYDGAGSARMTLDASSNLLVGVASGSLHSFAKAAALGSGILTMGSSTTGYTTATFYAADNIGANAANTAMLINKNNTTGRSINGAGTINASGADYAEYMTKASDFVLSKGDVAGIDANGKLTNVFADAVSFVVKSTDPSYVGNDKWGVDLEGDALEAARQLVDRIAFAGQVPVNVIGAKAGDYIVPVVDGTGIKGIAVASPTFEQYQLAVGKVIAIDADGRARIIVKVA